jgi:hypothetical protein
MILPGAGHIYLNLISKGVKISLVFVIVSYISLNLFPIISGFLGGFLPVFFQEQELPITTLQILVIFISLSFQTISIIPLIIIWYKQLKDIVKITTKQYNYSKSA